MPELCRFYNIVIKMIYSDNVQHHKPRFHAYFSGHEASVGIDGELYAAWNNAVRNIPFGKIEPLR